MEPPTSSRTPRMKMAKQLMGKLDDTPLHTAARAGNLNEITVTITTKEGQELKDLLSKQNQAGETALYVAVEYGYTGLVEELIKYYDMASAEIKAKNGYNAFHVAAKQGDLAVMKVLLEALPELSMTVAFSNTTALHTAAERGHIKVVNFLLQADCRLAKMARSNGKTALHLAARNGHVEVVNALLSKEPGIAALTDKKGQTALHMAAKGQMVELVKEMITSDPSMVNMVDNKGNTALHIATRKARAQIVKELLDHEGTDMKVINRVCETALDIAEKYGNSEIVAILQEYGVQNSRLIKSTVTEKGTHENYLRVTAEIMWKLIKILSLFPQKYEFYKDDIMQLWMALGYIPFPIDATQNSFTMMADEDVGQLYCDKLEQMQILQMICLNYTTRLPGYRLNQPEWLLRAEFDGYNTIDCNDPGVPEDTLYCAVEDDLINPILLKDLYRAKRLCALFVLHKQGSHFDQLPRELFLMLPHLRVLDLSRTNITELPSSIGNSKHLRYLNLSGTGIKTLPKSLTSLYEMQTLKLRECLKLVGLPTGMRKLINLRYLEVDAACLVASMPPGVGDLTQLRTLPAFIVGKQNGFHITELKNMTKIYGSLSILRLENVPSLEEAKEASLHRKIYLKKLELQWTESEDGFEILENLQPHTKIEELQIVGYSGARFSSWIGDPIFSVLTTVTIHNCRNCEVLPSLGKLPCLKFLCISEMNEVEVIDHRFCGRNMKKESFDLDGFVVGIVPNNPPDINMFGAFPWLENLTLNGMPKLEIWSGMEEGDFPRLQKLNISCCPKLTTLLELSVIASLQRLEISLCPLLDFLNKGLPASLQYLIMIDSPLLKDWCHKEGQDQGKLAHVPNVWLDYQ